LGPWGPLAIIALGIIQVLVAPLPGYPLVIVAGVLFGGWWGAIYTNIGILLAGMSAALLARTLGRPLVERFVESRHMARVEQLLESDSPWLWFFVLLLPTGDLPYFAAGLSRIAMRDYFVALAAARLPLTFLITHAAARASTLPPELLPILVLIFALAGLLIYWQQERVSSLLHLTLDRLSPSPTRRP
jgi:uncharacterized membrane protein YdjX (TVP38/TMEM64 family)